jgi:hypothetical protein
MPEPARLDGNLSGQSGGEREILIDGVGRVAKENDPLLSGEIANDASSSKLANDELQDVVNQRNQSETVASNVQDATSESTKSVAGNVGSGDSAAPPTEPATEAEAAQRAVDLDRLSLAPQPTEVPSDGGDVIDTPPTINASPEATFDSVDLPTFIDAEPLVDFDWAEPLRDVELPDAGTLPTLDFDDYPTSMGPDSLY